MPEPRAELVRVLDVRPEVLGIEPDVLEELGVEADAGVGAEALAYHPPQRDACERVLLGVEDGAAADVCMEG